MTIDDLEEEIEGKAEEDLEEVEGGLEEEVKENPICIKQSALIAARAVKSPLSREGISRFTAMIVLEGVKIRGQADPVGLAIEEVAAGILEKPALEKSGCMKPLVRNAGVNVKSPFGPQVISLFTAMIALVKAKAEISDQKNLPSALKAQALNGINPRSSLSN